MNRGELEAAVWQAMRFHRVTCPGPVRFVDTLLNLAAQYAQADPDAHLSDEARAAAIKERRAALDPVLEHRTMIMKFRREAVATAFGVSEKTVDRWRRRIREEGAR